MINQKQTSDTSINLFKDRRMLIIFSVTLSATMGISLVTPILPRLVEVFSITAEEVILLITAFTIPGVVAAPFWGILADRYGRKRSLVPAMLLFGIAGVSCAFASDFKVMLALRFLQGIGGAALYSLNNTLIGDLFPGATRIRAMGLNAAVISVGMALYPTLGGALASIHWSLPFFVPLFAIVSAAMVVFVLKNPEPRQSEPMKGYLGGAVKSMGEWRVLRLYLLTFLAFIITFGPIVGFLPLFMAESYHAGTTLIGIVISVSSAVAAAMSVALGWLGRHFRVSVLMAMSFVAYAVSLFAIPHLPSIWWLLIAVIVFGAGQGVSLPTVQALLAGVAPFRFRGVYMALNSMVILLGISLGPALGAVGYKSLGFGGLYKLSATVSFIMVVMLALWGRQLDEDDSSETEVA